MIEKSCWNTVVSMIFRGRRPSLTEIKCLKELFYKTYVAYMNTKDIDFSYFNYTISKLQNTEEELARLEEFYPTPQTVNIVEVDTMEEEFFFDDDYLKKVPEENLQDNDSIKKLVKVKNVLEKKANEFINLKLAENEYYSNLINLIGYGRIISLFRMYFMNKKVLNLSDLEMSFFKIAIPFLSETLACVQRSDSPEESKEYYSYLCFNCNTVGCHDRTPMRQKIASDEFQACSEMSTWFDRNGIVPQTPEIQFKCGFFEITIQVELENQTRKQSISKKTDLNWKTFIESGTKRSEVYRKYLDSFNYLTNCMTEEKMISKYYDKYDDPMTNYYATIKSYELVKDLVNLGNKSYVSNNIETVTLADLNISFEINDDSYSSVSLVKKEEYLESRRKNFFSGNIKFVRTS